MSRYHCHPSAAWLPLWVLLVWPTAGHAQVENSKYGQTDDFRQLEEALPTPNQTRTASGAPGPEYWQQQADYVIDVTLDDERQRILGMEKVTYFNRSPDTLTYLWLQLDPNIFAPQSDAALTAGSFSSGRLSTDDMQRLLARQTFDGSMQITELKNQQNQPLKYTIVKTMMRIEMDKPLQPQQSTEFTISWNYDINNARLIPGRTGYEHFAEDDNNIYEIAQWYPRMVAYTDYTGWQHKQFLGSGEFTLELGNFLLRITVPGDHVVAASGVLLNPDQVLTEQQQERWEKAKRGTRPVFIVTPEEAKANESHDKDPQVGTKTWIFKADNVRDVAFASSRKFIWDAMQHEVGGNPVMAMSFYPNEGEPLWSKYSTQAIIHTLNVYSRYTFVYPYPTAISVNGPVGGMEYPMICFNGPRPEKDGTYSRRTKYGLISVIIHEVGHNYFPMIVNSDERQWTWMDEGLNTFLQYLAEQEWEEDYPSWRGEPRQIVDFMRSSDQVPIMTNSESLLQFGNNAYAKPATALNILRETILGRELFDYAFKEYARRWQFKRPTPADFFRTMEDASGVDLDWFWRGWFYSTRHTDLALDGLELYTLDPGDPDENARRRRTERDDRPETLSAKRNQSLRKRIEEYPELKDFYNSWNEFEVTPADRKQYEGFLERLDNKEKKLLETKQNFYVVKLSNPGGLVMPVILEFQFEDGSQDEVRIPAEIWRRDHQRVSKLYITDKTIKSITLDPHLETADVELSNNHWPPQLVKSRFKIFKERKRQNEMQRAKSPEDQPADDQDEADHDGKRAGLDTAQVQERARRRDEDNRNRRRRRPRDKDE